MSEKKKSKLMIYLEYWAFLPLYHLLHVLPFRWAVRVACPLVDFLYLLDFKHRRRSISHILHAGAAAGEQEAKVLAKRSFHEYGKLLVEIVQMDKMYSTDRVTVSGPEATLDHILPERNPDGDRAVIVVTAHLGNWEVAGTAFAEKTGVEMYSLMRPFSNPLIGELILNHRRSAIHHLVPKSQGVRPMLKALRSKYTATVLIDQHASAGEGCVCEFFGHPARVHMTPAWLHLRSGVPILPELTVRTGDDFRFELLVGDLIYYKPTGDSKADMQNLTQQAITALEQMIRRYPEQWFWAPRHWLDIDRRYADLYKNWKPGDPDPRAPKAEPAEQK